MKVFLIISIFLLTSSAFGSGLKSDSPTGQKISQATEKNFKKKRRTRRRIKSANFSELNNSKYYQEDRKGLREDWRSDQRDDRSHHRNERLDLRKYGNSYED